MRLDKAKQFKSPPKYLEKALEQLQLFNIRHVEQLSSLLSTSTGRTSLAEVTSKKAVSEFEKRCEKYLGDEYQEVSLKTPFSKEKKNGFRLQDRTDYGLGLHYKNAGLSDDADILLSYFDEIPEWMGSQKPGSRSSVRQRRLVVRPESLPDARHQGKRGTCVAFSCLSLIDAFFLAGHAGETPRPRLSPQYVYFRAKQNDGAIGFEGTEFRHALDGLADHGCCGEEHLPYYDHNDWGQRLRFESRQHILEDLDKAAGRLRISGHDSLPNDDYVSEIRLQVDRGLAVGLAVPVFHNAWFLGFTRLRGEIALPITVKDSKDCERVLDVSRGGHAITIFGYDDNTNDSQSPRAGGGHFIFVNSWGQEWAFGNQDVNKPGYGLIPYKYVEKYCIGAHVISGVVCDTAEDGREFPAPSPAPPAKEGLPSSDDGRRNKKTRGDRKA